MDTNTVPPANYSTNVNPPLPQTPLSQQPNPPKSSSSVLIVLLVVLAVAGLGFGIFSYLKFQTKQAGNNIVTNPPPTQALAPTVSETNPTIPSPATTSVTAPPGYTIKDTLCYSITVPVTNDIGSENSCDLHYNASINIPKNKELLVGAGITSEWHEYTSSQDMADKWLAESQKNNPDDKVVTEGPVKVGGVDAYKILLKNSISTIESQFAFVYIPGKYTVHSYPVTGFSIIQTFSDPDNADAQKSEAEKLFNTWQWK